MRDQNKNSTFMIIIDKYLPFPSSNGSCISNLIKYLKENGDSIIVLSIYGTEDYLAPDNTEVYSMNITNTNVNLAEKIFGYLEDKLLVQKIVNRCLELNKKYQFDKIIGIFRPIESIIATGILSEKLNINCSYLFFDIPIGTSMKKYKQFLMQLNYNRLYRRITANGNVIAFKFYRGYFNRCLPNRFASKIKFIGTPNFLPADIKPIVETECINLVYTGSFYEYIRNPRKMLEFFKFIIGTNIVLHLYSWGCEDIVDDYKKIYEDNLIVHGKVSLGDAKNAMREANILVNLSNNSRYQVPGKIMEYFSCGKPIINFKFIENDLGNQDYDVYPLIYNVELYNKGNSQKCLEFIIKNSNKQIQISELQKLYFDSTPEYLSLHI